MYTIVRVQTHVRASVNNGKQIALRGEDPALNDVHVPVTAVIYITATGVVYVCARVCPRGYNNIIADRKRDGAAPVVDLQARDIILLLLLLYCRHHTRQRSARAGDTLLYNFIVVGLYIASTVEAYV